MDFRAQVFSPANSSGLAAECEAPQEVTSSGIVFGKFPAGKPLSGLLSREMWR